MRLSSITKNKLRTRAHARVRRAGGEYRDHVEEEIKRHKNRKREQGRHGA